MTGCTFSNDYKEDYNILENNSIRFIKSDASISFLINKDNTFLSSSVKWNYCY